jgi:hypothetical protein
MLARVDLASKITFEEFKKQYGKFYATEGKMKKAYDIAVKKFETKK